MHSQTSKERKGITQQMMPEFSHLQRKETQPRSKLYNTCQNNSRGIRVYKIKNHKENKKIYPWIALWSDGKEFLNSKDMKETERENIGKLSTSEKKTNILSNVSKQKRHLQNEKTTAKRTKLYVLPSTWEHRHLSVLHTGKAGPKPNPGTRGKLWKLTHLRTAWQRHTKPEGCY